MSDEDEEALQPPTPAERVLYAFAQMHRLWRRRAFPAPADAFEVEAIASLIGEAVELVSDGECGRAWHFAGGQVLTMRDDNPFPWCVIDVERWAFEEERAELLRDLSR